MKEVFYNYPLVSFEVFTKDVDSIISLLNHAVFLANDSSITTIVIERIYFDSITISTKSVKDIVHLKGTLDENEFSRFLEKLSRFCKDKNDCLVYRCPEATNVFLRKQVFEFINNIKGEFI